ncbi:tetratricopeptide repeat protein [Pelomonas cellulosilytica]|uniref:Sel1 repeat family protein n=1 Tax=Pelomonas cellulosilytica TaxID=2906762 RepID=A0ABS8XYG6_9BURK|nr:tetratricopeptide repeat protein [Pelomonas sp. P8]MCE4557003.1 sel1 repeat family protein [Pelomonas sp. P8]
MHPDVTEPPRLDPLRQGLALLRAPEPDAEQAVYWFQLAAEDGDVEGLALLAFCQLEGLGLPREPVQARERLERAAAEGSLTAKFNLGRALVAGWGGEADPARGIALYTAAAAAGHADATFNLAACLDAGWGCLSDRLAAKALFMRARALGSPLKAPGLRIRQRELDAVRELARHFENGEDLPRLVNDRQHKAALMQDLVRRPRGPGLGLAPRQGRATPAPLASMLTGLRSAVTGLFGPRKGRSLAN